MENKPTFRHCARMLAGIENEDRPESEFKISDERISTLLGLSK